MSSYELPILKPKAATPKPQQTTTYVVSRSAAAQEQATPQLTAKEYLQAFAARDAWLERMKSSPSVVTVEPLQTALEVSEPSDALEEEAERVAEHVMRMAEPASPIRAHSGPAVQRACASCEKEADDKKLVHRDAAGPAPSIGAGFEAGLSASRAGGGEALPDGVRAFMEPRFAKDFGFQRGQRVPVCRCCGCIGAPR